MKITLGMSFSSGFHKQIPKISDWITDPSGAQVTLELEILPRVMAMCCCPANKDFFWGNCVSSIKNKMLCFSLINQVLLARNCNYLLNSSCLEKQGRSEGLTVPEKPELWEGEWLGEVCVVPFLFPLKISGSQPKVSQALNFCDKRWGSSHTARQNSVLPAAQAAITSIPFLF